MIGATDYMRNQDPMTIHSTVFPSKTIAVTLALACAMALTVFTGVGQAHAADPGDDDFLGTAETFVIIASNAVVDTDPVFRSEVHGDVGLTATNTAAMELTVGQVINGTIYVAGPTPDPVAMQARADLNAAYLLVAAAIPTEVVGTANLALNSAHLVSGVYVYEPGVYNSGSDLLLDGDITLDGLNNLDSVFIFQASTAALNVRSGSHVNYINGAQACNVYWQVGSSATIETNAVFTGTILAATSIVLQTGATVDGQLLASALNAGAVTLDDNVINGQTLCVRTTTSGGVTTTTSRVDGVTTILPTLTPPPTPPATSGGSGSGGTSTSGGNRTLANTGKLANTGSETVIPTLAGGILAVGLGGLLLLLQRRRAEG
jgi:type VI secretion system secreted protein VgrG